MGGIHSYARDAGNRMKTAAGLTYTYDALNRLKTAVTARRLRDLPWRNFACAPRPRL